MNGERRIGVNGSAILSTDGRYRYTLERHWEPELDGRDGRVLFAMLNPSTADEHADDPTVRRCVGFARGWGYSCLSIVNLFALRSPDPAVLAAAADPVGPANDEWIANRAAASALIVTAWGSRGHLLERDAAVLDLLRYFGTVNCLGTTAAGMPRHPLYLGADTPLQSLDDLRGSG